MRQIHLEHQANSKALQKANLGRWWNPTSGCDASFIPRPRSTLLVGRLLKHVLFLLPSPALYPPALMP